MMKVSKIPMIMHEECMKSRNKMQKEEQKRLTGLQGQKPCKNLGGKWQKIDGGAFSQCEREKSWKTFEKVLLKKTIWPF